MVDGPTSIWECQEVRTLDGVNDAQRGASVVCSLTGADQRRLLGCFTNLSSLKSKLVIGWPSLYQIHRDLVYNGPLPPPCQCSPPHPPLRGRKSFTLVLPRHLAKVSGGCVWTHGVQQNTHPLGQRELQHRILVLTLLLALLVSLFCDPLSCWHRSRGSLYEHWCDRSLSFFCPH